MKLFSREKVSKREDLLIVGNGACDIHESRGRSQPLISALSRARNELTERLDELYHSHAKLKGVPNCLARPFADVYDAKAFRDEHPGGPMFVSVFGGRYVPRVSIAQSASRSCRRVRRLAHIQYNMI